MGKLAVVVVGQEKMKSFAQPEDWKALCSGLDVNEIGPARRGYVPPQARKEMESDVSGTNASIWPALGQPYSGEIHHPLLVQQ